MLQEKLAEEKLFREKWAVPEMLLGKVCRTKNFGQK